METDTIHVVPPGAPRRTRPPVPSSKTGLTSGEWSNSMANNKQSTPVQLLRKIQFCQSTLSQVGITTRIRDQSLEELTRSCPSPTTTAAYSALPYGRNLRNSWLDAVFTGVKSIDPTVVEVCCTLLRRYVVSVLDGDHMCIKDDSIETIRLFFSFICVSPWKSAKQKLPSPDGTTLSSPHSACVSRQSSESNLSTSAQVNLDRLVQHLGHIKKSIRDSVQSVFHSIFLLLVAIEEPSITHEIISAISSLPDGSRSAGAVYRIPVLSTFLLCCPPRILVDVDMLPVFTLVMSGFGTPDLQTSPLSGECVRLLQEKMDSRQYQSKREQALFTLFSPPAVDPLISPASSVPRPNSTQNDLTVTYGSPKLGRGSISDSPGICFKKLPWVASELIRTKLMEAESEMEAPPPALSATGNYISGSLPPTLVEKSCVRSRSTASRRPVSRLRGAGSPHQRGDHSESPLGFTAARGRVVAAPSFPPKRRLPTLELNKPNPLLNRNLSSSSAGLDSPLLQETPARERQIANRAVPPGRSASTYPRLRQNSSCDSFAVPGRSASTDRGDAGPTRPTLRMPLPNNPKDLATSSGVRSHSVCRSRGQSQGPPLRKAGGTLPIQVPHRPKPIGAPPKYGQLHAGCPSDRDKTNVEEELTEHTAPEMLIRLKQMISITPERLEAPTVRKVICVPELLDRLDKATVATGDLDLRWQESVDVLFLIRQIVRHQFDVLFNEATMGGDAALAATFTALMVKVSRTVDSLRSQISRMALLCMQDLFFFGRRNMNPHIHLFLPIGLKRSADMSNAFLSQEADDALIALVRSVSENRLAPVLLSCFKQSKSQTIKAKCLQLTAVLFVVVGANFSLCKDYLQLLKICLISVRDPSAECRNFSRIALWVVSAVLATSPSSLVELHKISKGSNVTDDDYKSIVDARHERSFGDVAAAFTHPRL